MISPLSDSVLMGGGGCPLKTFLLSQLGEGVILESGEWRLGMPLNILPRTVKAPLPPHNRE